MFPRAIGLLYYDHFTVLASLNGHVTSEKTEGPSELTSVRVPLIELYQLSNSKYLQHSSQFAGALSPKYKEASFWLAPLDNL